MYIIYTVHIVYIVCIYIIYIHIYKQIDTYNDKILCGKNLLMSGPTLMAKGQESGAFSNCTVGPYFIN